MAQELSANQTGWALDSCLWQLSGGSDLGGGSHGQGQSLQHKWAQLLGSQSSSSGKLDSLVLRGLPSFNKHSARCSHVLGSVLVCGTEVGMTAPLMPWPPRMIPRKGD